jgi:hypothetical protein
MKTRHPRKGALMVVTLGLLQLMLMLQVTHAHAQPPGWKQRLISFLFEPLVTESESESETKPHDDEMKSAEESNEPLSDDTSESNLLIPMTVDGNDTAKEKDDEEEKYSQDFEEDEEEMLVEDVIDNDKTTTTQKKKKVHIPILSTIDAMLELGGYPASQRNLRDEKKMKAVSIALAVAPVAPVAKKERPAELSSFDALAIEISALLRSNHRALLLLVSALPSSRCLPP